jgi:predicted nucleic acid-binding protein
MPDYIFDTTVLSNFAAVKRLDLLATRYQDVAFTTIEVIDELRKGVKAGYVYLDPILQAFKRNDPDNWISILGAQSATERRLRIEFDDRLDPGEASCLALAIFQES